MRSTSTIARVAGSVPPSAPAARSRWSRKRSEAPRARRSRAVAQEELAEFVRPPNDHRIEGQQDQIARWERGRAEQALQRWQVDERGGEDDHAGDRPDQVWVAEHADREQ